MTQNFINTYGIGILSKPDNVTLLISNNGLLLGFEQTVDATPAGRLVRDGLDFDDWGRWIRGGGVRRSG